MEVKSRGILLVAIFSALYAPLMYVSSTSFYVLQYRVASVFRPVYVREKVDSVMGCTIGSRACSFSREKNLQRVKQRKTI